ncbi:unnamed protein product [Rhizoctonia solani]|uniref:Uncharacterized protein n=1 Tax=Rhizoctonia solani TaxID=456999 RepID=A0A8H2XD87_9AGAM|nr:unnamed protein product [Rhizoctonia solani]
MKDSAGYNGGSSLLWTMSAGSGGCALDPSPITPSTLSFTRTGSAQCGEINYVMNNGTSPYQIEIIPEIHQRRTLYFATNKFGFIMDLPTGLNVYIAITDAAGNSGVDELMTIGTSNDNSCLKAAGTVSVGRVSTMYTGSGVSMPTAAITSTSSKTDQGAISSTGTPLGGNNSTGGTGNLPVILGIIVGVVAIASLISIYLCIRHRRQSRTASRTQRPANVMQQVIPYTYHGPPAPQYPSITVPQIQTPGPHAPYSENQTTTRPPNDAYTQKFTGVTTHVPRPQSYQIGQSILIDNNTSPDISPYTSRFSQGTFPGSGNILTASRLSSDTGDEKRHTTSPPLPPGALPPFPPSPGSLAPKWIPQTPGTPGDNVRPFIGSPRSETSTTLPPYETAREISGSKDK